MSDRKYKLIITKRAMKDFKKIDQQDAKKIIAWMNKNLLECNDPKLFGKALLANKSGLWRYRVGSFRIIVTIREDIIAVEVLTVGHRSTVYKK
jgi:Cytotoxic translational repressor of toxin-antitoxin stability system